MRAVMKEASGPSRKLARPRRPSFSFSSRRAAVCQASRRAFSSRSRAFSSRSEANSLRSAMARLATATGRAMASSTGLARSSASTRAFSTRTVSALPISMAPNAAITSRPSAKRCTAARTWPATTSKSSRIAMSGVILLQEGATARGHLGLRRFPHSPSRHRGGAPERAGRTGDPSHHAGSGGGHLASRLRDGGGTTSSEA